MRVVAEAEVVDPRGPPVTADQLVRPFVDDFDAHVLQHGQHVRQRHRPVAEDLETAVAGIPAVRLVETHGDAAGIVEGVDAPQVGNGGARREVLLVGLRKGAGVVAGEPRRLLLAHGVDERLGEVVVPRPRRLAQSAFELGGVDLRQSTAARDAHHEVQPGEDRLGDPGGVVDAVAGECVTQDLLHAPANFRRVAVARQVDEA